MKGSLRYSQTDQKTVDYLKKLLEEDDRKKGLKQNQKKEQKEGKK